MWGETPICALKKKLYSDGQGVLALQRDSHLLWGAGCGQCEGHAGGAANRPGWHLLQTDSRLYTHTRKHQGSWAEAHRTRV